MTNNQPDPQESAEGQGEVRALSDAERDKQLDAMRVTEEMPWPHTDDFALATAQNWIGLLYDGRDADRETIAALRKEVAELGREVYSLKEGGDYYDE